MHPMYSLGYIGFYGISLLACSYTVLFVSILAHISQFIFLYVVEEPHINKIYNPKSSLQVKSKIELAKELMSTERAFDRPARSPECPGETEYAKIDILKDISIFRPFDPYRVTDLTQMLVIGFGVLFALLTPHEGAFKVFSVLQAFSWRIVHSVGLFYSLKGQSNGKTWTKHFLKFGDTPRRAWHEWKSIYALSLTMTHVTFLIAAWKSYSIPADWQYSTVTLRHILGLALIGMHVWMSTSIYDVLGDFGWYFGDFFVDEKIPKLKYTGIYRYLNNPERVVYSFWGFAMISYSPAVLTLAIEAQILNLVFVTLIEKPHMYKLYGSQVRKEAGFTRSLKSMPVVDHPQVKRKVEKIEESLDRALELTIKSFQDCLEQAKPHLSKAFEESKTRLNRYQNSIMIARISENLESHDLSQYSLSLVKRASNIYDLGEPIRVSWKAPENHSRKDWIGIYRVTDNLSKQVTKVSSQSRWSAIHATGFDDHTGSILLENKNDGTIELRGDTVPWQVGTYELRYHHEGKHNVMSITAPFEISVAVSTEQNYYKIEQDLLQFVGQILSSVKGTSVPQSADDHIVFGDDAEKFAARIAYGIHKRYNIDFAWQLIASDASIRNITARIARSRQILAPFVSYDEVLRQPEAERHLATQLAT